MISELVTARHLSRKAVVYIRQSHPQQVLNNQESLRLQYALRQRACDLGWDEAAKIQDLPTPSLRHFQPHLEAARSRPGG